jgi:hypothetical protein
MTTRINKRDRIKVTHGKYARYEGIMKKINDSWHCVKLEGRGLHWITKEYCELIWSAPDNGQFDESLDSDSSDGTAFVIGDRVEIIEGPHACCFGIILSSNQVRNMARLDNLGKIVIDRRCLKFSVVSALEVAARPSNASS